MISKCDSYPTAAAQNTLLLNFEVYNVIYPKQRLYQGVFQGGNLGTWMNELGTLEVHCLDYDKNFYFWKISCVGISGSRVIVG